MAWDHPKAAGQWGQGHQLPLHMPFPRTSSCHARAPLQFPKEGKGFKSNFWISCSKETDSLLPFTQKGAAKGRDRSSCRASSVPWTQPWELVLLEKGTLACWGSRAGRSRQWLLLPPTVFSGYQNFMSRVVCQRICLWLCSITRKLPLGVPRPRFTRANPTGALCHRAGAGHPVEG